EKGMKGNARLWTWPKDAVERIIHESARIKAEVVRGDQFETPLKGGREILNFGHTVGHALEAAKKFNTISHGQAVSVGMVVAGQQTPGRRGAWLLAPVLRGSIVSAR
ncbi:MAG: hypothetical protein IH986_15600, partial [Planctomycetes bacterium]|nr:hypothetical protein [Planctomycetota bacterium]